MESAPAPARQEGHSVGFNLAAIALFVGVAAVGLAYAIDATSRAHRSGAAAPAEIVTRTIGDTTLRVPVAWLGGENSQAGGFSRQVDLSLTLSFFSVIFWTFVIGPLGAILSIPLTLFVRALVLEGDPGAAWLRWLSGDRTARPVDTA